MLILSRLRDETIVIGSGENMVTITVTDIRGDKVRLGITAPRSIAVHRKEVYDAIQRNEFDKEFVADSFGPLTKDAKERLNRAKEKN